MQIKHKQISDAIFSINNREKNNTQNVRVMLKIRYIHSDFTVSDLQTCCNTFKKCCINRKK